MVKILHLFHIIPKPLATAVAKKIDGATPAILLVYALIIDRFNVTKGADKYCSDSNENIQRRTGLSKVTVEKSISWLLRKKFLIAEYEVLWYDASGTPKKTFSSNKKAKAFWLSLKSDSTIVRSPKRIIKPPEEPPTFEDLGLELKDKKNGLYSKIENVNFIQPQDKNYPDTDENLSDPPKENVAYEGKNYGAKLEQLNEIKVNETIKELNPRKDMYGNTISSNLPAIPAFDNFITVKEALQPFTLKDLKTDRDYIYDPNFAVSLVALNTLRLSGLLGEANYQLSCSILQTTIQKITFGHFLYASKAFKELGEPVWFGQLLLNFEDELQGLNEQQLQRFVEQLN